MLQSTRTYDAPGLSGPADADDRVATRASELVEAWEQDAAKLEEAADHVIACTSWGENAAACVAGAMLGHPDDQIARDLRFMAELRGRVADRLQELAQEQAEEESASWPTWRSVQRMRARAAA